MAGPTPDDYRDFGEDLVGFAQRAAAPIVDQRVGLLEHQLNEVRSTMLQQQAAANQERVERDLDADSDLRDRWRALNTDDGFLRWLDAEDRLSGLKRLHLLRDAHRNGHSWRVKAIFNSYLAEQHHPAHQRTAERRPFEATAPQPRTTYTDLNDRRKRWSRAEVAAFYADRRKGKYSGREQEAARIEAAIFEAARSGRVEPAQLKMAGE